MRELRAEFSEQARWSFSSQQATLRMLDKAFAAFFRRCKLGEKPGYPRFRSAHRFDSVTWPSDGDGCRWKPEHAQVYLQGVGTLKVSVHRPVLGVVKTVQVKREGRRWFLVLSCDGVAASPMPATGTAVGIDMGVTVFAATSDGDLIANPRHGRKGADRLARAQRVLAKKEPRSLNRTAAREVVGTARSPTNGGTSTTRWPDGWSTPTTCSASRTWP